MAHNRPKPDDRSDNVEKLQNKIHNTIENMESAEESLAVTSDETQIQQIKEKMSGAVKASKR